MMKFLRRIIRRNSGYVGRELLLKKFIIFYMERNLNGRITLQLAKWGVYNATIILSPHESREK